jgi:hypothetical protein
MRTNTIALATAFALSSTLAFAQAGGNTAGGSSAAGGPAASQTTTGDSIAAIDRMQPEQMAGRLNAGDLDFVCSVDDVEHLADRGFAAPAKDRKTGLTFEISFEAQPLRDPAVLADHVPGPLEAAVFIELETDDPVADRNLRCRQVRMLCRSASSEQPIRSRVRLYFPPSLNDLRSRAWGSNAARAARPACRTRGRRDEPRHLLVDAKAHMIERHRDRTSGHRNRDHLATERNC